MELDLQQLTTEVCRIATEAGGALVGSVWWKSMRMTMCRMLIKNLNAC